MASRARKHETLLNFLQELTCFRCQGLPEPNDRKRFKCVEKFHTLCSKCASKACLCQSAVCQSHCSMTEKVLQTMQTWFCKNRPNGCQEILDENEYEEHVNGCIYRKINCVFIDCPLVLAKDFMEHYNTEHEDEQPTVDYEEGKNKFTIEYDNLEKFEYVNYSFWPTKLLASNGDLFFQVDRIGSDEVMHFWVYYMGSVADAANYSYTFYLTGKSQEEFIYHGPVIPLDENHTDVIAKHRTFMIGTQAIKRLIEGGLLNIEVTIHCLKDNDNESSGVSEG